MRIIAAMHRPLEALVAAQAFHADLYYRLRVVQFELPPLRARGADIMLQALTSNGWNVTRAARALGILRDTLRYRIEKFQLSADTS